MKKPCFFLTLTCLFLALSPAQGTTVVPPTFDELVSQAEVIFQGAVTDVRSQWTGEGAQRCIVSYVTFRVEDPLKGTPGNNYTVRLLGGTVDGETMEVTDSPKFKVGDRDILFVEHNGSQFVPLVGIMHGRFHVQKDEVKGREVVTTNERDLVKDVSKLGRDGRTTAAASVAAASRAEGLSPNEFKSAIRQTLQTQPETRKNPDR
jgi:hypothetical protein